MNSVEQMHLNGNTVMELVQFKPPYTVGASFKDEACFIHVLKGNVGFMFNNTQYQMQSNDSIMMYNKQFVDLYFTQSNTTCKVLIIHFCNDVLHYIFNKSLPPIFNRRASNKSGVDLLNKNELVSMYVHNLLYFFENEQQTNSNIIALKMKEVLLVISQLETLNTSLKTSKHENV